MTDDDIKRDRIGCSDGSCIFGAPPGMHTNGGCQCLKEAVRDKSRTSITIRRLAGRAEALAKVAAFARHADECAMESHPLYDGPCTCGLDAARKEAGL